MEVNQIVNMYSGHKLPIPGAKLDWGRTLMMMEASLAIAVSFEWVLLKLVAIACGTLLGSFDPIITLISHIEPRGPPLTPPSMAGGTRRGASLIFMVSVRVERRLRENGPSRMALFVQPDGSSGRRQEG